jgi:hypothetical protein
MAKDPTDVQRVAQAAIDEASRTVAESSRRTSERAQQATRTTLDQGYEMNRALLNTWIAGSESFFRAAFEVQNAALRGGLAWWQTVAEISRAAVQVVEQWEGVTRQAQQAGLEAFQATSRGLATTIDQSSSSSSERIVRASR